MTEGVSVEAQILSVDGGKVTFVSTATKTSREMVLPVDRDIIRQIIDDLILAASRQEIRTLIIREGIIRGVQK